MGGLALFALSSLVCGFAPSSELLVLARMVQGAPAAVMAPSALSIIVATFPEGRERNKALGAWGVTGGIGGPLVPCLAAWSRMGLVGRGSSLSTFRLRRTPRLVSNGVVQQED